MDVFHQWARTRDFRHSHGGIDCGSTHIMGLRMSQRPTKAKPLIEPVLLRMIPRACDGRHPKGSFPPIKLLAAYPAMPWKQAEQSTEEVPPAMPHGPAAVH